MNEPKQGIGNPLDARSLGAMKGRDYESTAKWSESHLDRLDSLVGDLDESVGDLHRICERIGCIPGTFGEETPSGEHEAGFKGSVHARMECAERNLRHIRDLLNALGREF